MEELILREFSASEVETYLRLAEAERLVDEELVRRQISLREAQSLIDPRVTPLQFVRKLRLSLMSRTCGAPPGAAPSPLFFGTSLEEPSWTLRVQGVFVERERERALVFSEVVDKVCVHVPSEVYVYEASAATTPEDGFELKRRWMQEAGQTPVAQIEVYLKKSMELLELPEELARLVGAEIATLPAVYRSLCGYIKNKGLLVHGAGNAGAAFSSEFVPDELLADILQLPGEGTSYHLSVLVRQLRTLFPWESRVLRFSHPLHTAAVQEFDVLVDAAGVEPRLAGLTSAEPLEFVQLSRQIADIDREIAVKTDELRRALDREKLLQALAQQPEQTIRGVLAEGSLPAGELGSGVGRHTQAAFYRQPWAVAAAHQIALGAGAGSGAGAGGGGRR